VIWLLTQCVKLLSFSHLLLYIAVTSFTEYKAHHDAFYYPMLRKRNANVGPSLCRAHQTFRHVLASPIYFSYTKHLYDSSAACLIVCDYVGLIFHCLQYYDFTKIAARRRRLGAVALASALGHLYQAVR